MPVPLLCFLKMTVSRFAQISAALHAGHDVPDSVFDQCLPPEFQQVSPQHWTPLDVIRRVSTWIDQMDIRTVVDIGAGVGKFCVAAALTSRARFVGIEQRERLVLAARQLAQSFQIEDRVSFEWGIVGSRTLPPADAYYLFNPFGENLYANGGYIDQEVELSWHRYARDVETTRQFLDEVPLGTYVITYNGYGTTLPRAFFDVEVEYSLTNVLRLSQKVAPQ